MLKVAPFSPLSTWFFSFLYFFLFFVSEKKGSLDFVYQSRLMAKVGEKMLKRHVRLT